MSKPKQSRSSKKKKHNSTTEPQPSKTMVESVATEPTFDQPNVTPSPASDQTTVDAFIEKEALHWHRPSNTQAELVGLFKWAGLNVQAHDETLLANVGGDGPALLVYLPTGSAQAADLSTMLVAIAAWREGGKLPCTVKILAGPLTQDWLQAHRTDLKADAIVYGLGEYDRGRPVISLGLKGLLEVEMEARTLSQDAPAAYSEIMPAASWQLIRALDALKSDSQEIKIDDFEDGLAALPAEESRQLLKTVGEHSERLAGRLKQYGLKSYIFELGDALVLQTEYRVPTVNISAIECGDFTTGRLKLPATARARLDFHLLPDQKPDHVFEALQNYLSDRNFEGLTVRQLPGAIHPTRTPLDHPFIQGFKTEVEAITGQPALIAPISPFSGPLSWLKEVIGKEIPAICLGLGEPHPDEDTLVTQAKILARLLPIVAELKPIVAQAAPVVAEPKPDQTTHEPEKIEAPFTFELPPMFEETMLDVEVTLPSAPVATAAEEELIEPFDLGR